MWWWFLAEPKRKRQPMERAVVVTPPSSALWDLVLDLDWARVIEHANAFPIDAEWTDGHWHETPLYLACQHNPPLEVIQAIVRAYPCALQCPTRGNKDLPIHIACRYQLSEQIIEELLRDYPVTAVEQTRWGKTPLMALWEFRIQPGEQDEDYLDDEVWRKILIVLTAVARFRELPSYQYQSPKTRKKRFRSMGSMPVECNNGSSEDTIHLGIVHAAVSLGALSCPVAVLERCLRDFPEQAFRRDPWDQLPLHLAVGPTTWNPSTRRQYRPREHDFIHLLLDAHPEAARETNRNDNCRYPLHSAISNRHTWNGGIECLFHAAPEVLLTQDPVSKLYPFQLAAVPVRDSSADLETIYMLLRSHPDVLTLMDFMHTRRQVETLLVFSQKSRRFEKPFQCSDVREVLLGILTAVSIGSAAGMVFGGFL